MGHHFITNQDNQHKYYLDWLKIIALFVIIIYHTSLIFTSQWHIFNEERIPYIGSALMLARQICIPLFFFISGAGVYFSLQKTKGKRFLIQKIKRLLIPFLFGIIIINPPQQYFELLHRGKEMSFFYFYTIAHSLISFKNANTLFWNHLWYLIYLFVFSIPMIFFAQDGYPALKIYIRFLTSFLSKKYNLFLLLIPIILIDVLLFPFWPKTKNLISDWHDLSFMFFFFCLGYLVFSNLDILTKIDTHIRVLTLFIFALIGVLYITKFYENQSFSFFYFINRISYSSSIFLTILVLVSLARKYLNFTNKSLRYLNEGLLPLYILHQTVTIILAYYIIDLDFSPIFKFVIIFVIMLVICFAMYEFIIRRLNVLRILFGLARAKSNKTSIESVLITKEEKLEMIEN